MLFLSFHGVVLFLELRVVLLFEFFAFVLKLFETQPLVSQRELSGLQEFLAQHCVV